MLAPDSNTAERLRKLEALAARPGTPGEGAAARAAINRLMARLRPAAPPRPKTIIGLHLRLDRACDRPQAVLCRRRRCPAWRRSPSVRTAVCKLRAASGMAQRLSCRCSDCDGARWPIVSVADPQRYGDRAMSAYKTKRQRAFERARDMLRKPGARLMLMHTRRPTGRQYYIVPGGPIDRDIAEEIIGLPDVSPGLDGLFPRHSQTWTILRDAGIVP
jgi:hypothetical protein